MQKYRTNAAMEFIENRFAYDTFGWLFALDGQLQRRAENQSLEGWEHLFGGLHFDWGTGPVR
jgi:hypothetical protein